MVGSKGRVSSHRRKVEIDVLVEQAQKTRGGGAYIHAHYERRRNVLRWMIDNIGFRFLAKVDRVEGLENFPMTGPAIVMINHIAFIDPIVVLGNLPRNIVPLSKVEAYRYPIWGIFPWLWHVIPVHRDTVDRTALRLALGVLGAGEVILVAPEGTRNPCLQRAKEGVAYLGSRSGAPIVPVAVEGTSGFPTFSRTRWRKPGAVVRIGRPFRYRATGRRARREALRVMTDEAMFVLASMLSEERRGHYVDLSIATADTIEFL
jgi:1-acyl-sn-glycerol-3-phosphate acyltransferase